jgi:hypothetical protein
MCFALALLSASGNGTVAQHKAANSKQFPFVPGEELVYETEVSRSLLRGVDVAELRFGAAQARITPKGAPADDPVTVFRFTGEVVSKGFFLHVFGVHFSEHIESIVDPAAFTVLTTEKTDEQGKRARQSEAVFDHDARRVTWTEHNLRDPSQAPRVASADFTEPVQDALSGIYFLRTEPLEVGKSFEVQISDSGRVVRIRATVTERKRMNTVLGSVNVLRVEPVLFGEQGMVRGEGKLSIWLTDDSRHIPVRAQLKIEQGTFDIKLKRLNHNVVAGAH